MRRQSVVPLTGQAEADRSQVQLSGVHLLLLGAHSLSALSCLNESLSVCLDADCAEGLVYEIVSGRHSGIFELPSTTVTGLGELGLQLC